MTDVAKARIWMDAKWHRIIKWGNGIATGLLAVNWGLAQVHLPDIQQYVPPHYFHLATMVVAAGTFASMMWKGKTS